MSKGTFNPDIVQICAPGAREYNEDGTYCIQLNNQLVAAVADGLGGQGCGSLASGLVLESITNLAQSPDTIDKGALLSAFDRANADVLQAQKERMVSLMSTLVVLSLTPNGFLIAHTGDSRAYHFRNGKIVFQTLDHSLPQLEVQAGKITSDQIRTHSRRNKLLRAIGGQRTVEPDFFSGTPTDGDAFLLCSDGFWEPVTEKEMEDDLKNSDSAKDWLALMLQRIKARMNDDSDNLSAIAIRI